MGSVVSSPLRLRVLTPERVLLDARDVAWVQVQLADGGGIGIWPGHAPLLAETSTAPLRYADHTGEHTVKLEAGILEISCDGITIFTNGLTGEEQPSLRAERDEGEGAMGPNRVVQALLATLDVCHKGGS